MFRSFLLITFRILWRNKVTSFVNVFSLSVGVTAFIFIILYVRHETSYDKFHANYERIYRLEAEDYGRLPPAIGQHLEGRIPEIEKVILFSSPVQTIVSYSPESDPDKIRHIEVKHLMADSTVFDVFTFPFIQGNPKTALKNPMTAVLTETTAKKIFGEKNPIGESIIWEKASFEVTGIIKDVRGSHVEIDLLTSLSSFPTVFPGRDLKYTGPNSWAWSPTFLLMTGKIDESLVEAKINEILAEINDGKFIDTQFEGFHIRPLKDLYFDGQVQKLSYGLHGNLNTIMLLLAVGVFMLLLAGINYVNLTTARSHTRIKELAVKRITGSSSGLLRFQLMSESVLLSFISLAAALTIVQILLPRFNELTSVHIQVSDINQPVSWAVIIGGALLVGIVAGIYPAFYLTSIQPVRLIKGAGGRGPGGSWFKSGLMTLQFAISMIMIVAIIVNFRQLRFVRTADLGFNKGQVVIFDTPSGIPNEVQLRETFRTRLLHHASIKNATFSWGMPGVSVADSPTLDINGIRTSIKGLLVEPAYLDVMEIKLIEGRNFSTIGNVDKTNFPVPPHARAGAVILNETAVREFGFVDPVGKVIYAGDTLRNQLEIIGVVKDFHFRSFHEKIEPLTLMWFDAGATASVRIAGDDVQASLKAIETEWRNTWGNALLDYAFLDETFDRQYNRDEQLAIVVSYFTGLAVVVACLGLFAVSSFMVSSRVKEIGVRKSLGASVKSIYSMLSWDFLKWILLAITLATPVAWYLMNLWLSTFEYHVNLGPDVFVMAALFAISVALITVTWQSLKAARANPVESLRYE